MKTKAKNKKLPAVIVRTYSAGVHFGYLVKRLDKEVHLTRSRRIWSWCGANTLSEIATFGVAEGSRVAVPVDIILTEAIEIISCAKTAVANLDNAKWKQ